MLDIAAGAAVDTEVDTLEPDIEVAADIEVDTLEPGVVAGVAEALDHMRLRRQLVHSSSMPYSFVSTAHLSAAAESPPCLD